ncbi:hypothetical protein TRFO_43319 [Tritrichomonas foetus]|uniref:Tubby C-terminal domain-containing protein n=1 Tax=Tritrichomonas foetus TaxID=1144522 RepID=A0A1J4KQS1_9EUKA|nr:hypothetical protein TRFO_43319 [Tritrichomonas foetus]|eukprot:OHT13442.1 hypothetical protein TRFO_43319 [Tritrichomonas foetus]
MSIHCVKLPAAGSDSDYDDSSDFEPPPPPVRHQAPKRADVNQESHKSNPFELSETTDTNEQDIPTPTGDVDLTKLGLPQLSFGSDPFLSPVESIQFVVTRHRIWVRGVKGLKFTCSIGDHTILVAKRKMKYLKKTWFMSRSSNFSIDTPDLTGMLIMQRKGASFSLFSPKERMEDQCHEALAGINLDKGRNVVLFKDLWLKPQEDDVFSPLKNENATPLLTIKSKSKTSSVKNGAFKLKDATEPCFTSEKQTDKSVLVTAKAPLSMTQAFGIVLSLYLQ